MRIVVAPDKFKGSLIASAAAGAMAEGIRRTFSDAEVDLCPLADGGEGTAEALATAAGGRVVTQTVTGPLPGTRAAAQIAFLPDGTAAFDMATAAGFLLLDEQHRDPTHTTSFGVGELIRIAAEAGCRRVIVGLGGSATCDAGLGAAQALGAEIRTAEGVLDRPVVGRDLQTITFVKFRPGGPDGLEVVCLCDVDNPLFGPRGSAHVFAPQKGATPTQVDQLDLGLQQVASLTDAMEIAGQPGMGAAGGLGFGLHLATGAALRPGLETVADAVKLHERLRTADLCFTGEGRFDSQSLCGKTTIGVARRCKALGVPCIVLAGSVDPALDVREEGVTAYRSIVPGPLSLDAALREATPLLEHAAADAMRLFLAGAGRSVR